MTLPSPARGRCVRRGIGSVPLWRIWRAIGVICKPLQNLNGRSVLLATDTGAGFGMVVRPRWNARAEPKRRIEQVYFVEPGLV